MNNISINYRRRIDQIYSKPKTNKTKSSIFNKYFSQSNVKYYSYGRYALFYGLKYIGVKNDDQVLLPAFICRDVLSAINSLGAIPVFYDVNQELYPLDNFNELPKCKAVIAVNYFGFPQDLTPFIEYCNNNGSILIEDNAHGFLSCDRSGKLLGTRANIGIFSFRKTIHVNCGAALFINKINNTNTEPHTIEPRNYNISYFHGKSVFRVLFPLIGIRGIRIFTHIIRFLRKIRTGHYHPHSENEAEISLPLEQAAPIQLYKNLKHLDIIEESVRRRELYLWLYGKIIEFGGKPVNKDLPKGCVPYGFPFYAPVSLVKTIENKLLSIGLETFSWPDLPNDLTNNIPDHYKLLRCVRFLW